MFTSKHAWFVNVLIALSLVLARTASADPFAVDFTEPGSPNAAHEQATDKDSTQAPAIDATDAGDALAEPDTLADANAVTAEADEIRTSRAAPQGLTTVASDEDVRGGNFTANYFGILYGPSLSRPSSRYQPDGKGETNFERPVELKNWAALAYHFNEDISIAPTVYFTNTLINGQGFTMRDPFIRLTDASIWSHDSINLFGDFRLHFPISQESKANDLKVAFQFREILGWAIPTTRWEIGVANSQWLRSFGSKGYGDDLTLYVAPYAMYQVAPTLAATLLYEMQAAHTYGAAAFELSNDGTDFEPGLSWDITRDINFNPYLNIYTGESISFKSTAIGANLSVRFF